MRTTPIIIATIIANAALMANREATCRAVIQRASRFIAHGLPVRRSSPILKFDAGTLGIEIVLGGLLSDRQIESQSCPMFIPIRLVDDYAAIA